VQELSGTDNPDAVKLMAGFGGGIGGMGSVCGAVVGAVAALGLRYGRGEIQDREDPRLFPLCAEFYRRFTAEIEQSHFCRDITGIDFTKPEDVKTYIASPEKTAGCGRLVARSVEVVREILSREEQAARPSAPEGSKK
jgi:C_GCAxxG_C_C family probable redox protein